MRSAEEYMALVAAIADAGSTPVSDYVKSLKTSVGSRISKPEQVDAVVADMRCYRGVIEGGFCVRRVEAFLPDTERRYFMVLLSVSKRAYCGHNSPIEDLKYELLDLPNAAPQAEGHPTMGLCLVSTAVLA